MWPLHLTKQTFCFTTYLNIFKRKKQARDRQGEHSRHWSSSEHFLYWLVVSPCLLQYKSIKYNIQRGSHTSSLPGFNLGSLSWSNWNLEFGFCGGVVPDTQRNTLVGRWETRNRTRATFSWVANADTTAPPLRHSFPLV